MYMYVYDFCVLLLQVFTSIFALNGHIRVHGGRSVVTEETKTSSLEKILCSFHVKKNG